jgi:hypothetical protein
VVNVPSPIVSARPLMILQDQLTMTLWMMCMRCRCRVNRQSKVSMCLRSVTERGERVTGDEAVTILT